MKERLITNFNTNKMSEVKEEKTLTPETAAQAIERALNSSRPLIVMSIWPLHFRDSFIESATAFANRFAEKKDEVEILFVDDLARSVRAKELRERIEDETQRKVSEFITNPENRDKYRDEAINLAELVGGVGVVFDINKLRKALKVGWTEITNKLTALASFGYVEFDEQRPTSFAKFVIDEVEIAKAKTGYMSNLFNEFIRINGDVLQILNRVEDKSVLTEYKGDLVNLLSDAVKDVEEAYAHLRPEETEQKTEEPTNVPTEPTNNQ